MLGAIYFELLRVLRDRSFWFWSLFGIPILGPVLFALLTLVLSAGQTPDLETTAARDAIVLEDHFTPPLRPFLIGAGLDVVEPGQPARGTLTTTGAFKATLTLRPKVNPGKLAETVQRVLDQHRQAHLGELYDALDTPSAERRTNRTVLTIETEASPSNNVALNLTIVIWMWLVVVPYMQVARLAGGSLVSDRLSGAYPSILSGTLSSYECSMIRLMSIGVVSVVISAVYLLFLLVFMMLYGWAADHLVSAGVLEGLSETARATATVAFVSLAQLWRELSYSDLWTIFCITSSQLLVFSALVLLGSAYAKTIAQSRLFELLPFSLVFLLPMATYGSVGSPLTGLLSFVPGALGFADVGLLIADHPLTRLRSETINGLFWMLCWALIGYRLSTEAFLSASGVQPAR